MNTERWVHQIDSITSDFTTSFVDLTSEELNWKPNDQTWSVAQNIDHLIVINRTYFSMFKQIKDGNYSIPWLGKFGFITKFFGKIILQSVQPDRRKKMKTFPLWEPSKSKIDKAILDQFKAHQEELKTAIIESSDLLDKETVISSPANKNIVYTLATAFDIIITHEKRHLEQAKEVLMQIG